MSQTYRAVSSRFDDDDETVTDSRNRSTYERAVRVRGARIAKRTVNDHAEHAFRRFVSTTER